MTNELSRILRRIKPDRIFGLPPDHPTTSLFTPSTEADTGKTLLLDTTVYLDTLRAKLPPDAKRLIAHRHIVHSAICIAELTHQFGALDPKHPNTTVALRQLQHTLDIIPRTRSIVPTLDQIALAGVLSGLMQRLWPTRPFAHRYLNDAIIYTQAMSAGFQILTRNAADFHLLNKLTKQQIAIAY